MMPEQQLCFKQAIVQQTIYYVTQQPVLLGVTLFSLVLTAFDWGVAYAGVIVNFAILAVLWLGPRIANLFSR